MLPAHAEHVSEVLASMVFGPPRSDRPQPPLRWVAVHRTTLLTEAAVKVEVPAPTSKRPSQPTRPGVSFGAAVADIRLQDAREPRATLQRRLSCGLAGNGPFPVISPLGWWSRPRCSCCRLRCSRRRVPLPHPPSAPLIVGGLSLSRPPRTPAGARRVAHRASLP